MAPSSMNTVILVPRRDDNGYRDELWSWTKAWWEREQSHMPIIEGYHTDGLFNRSAAVNTAARIAGEWDVAVIIDADVTCSPDRVKEACERAYHDGRMYLPHSTRYDLSRRSSEAIRRGQLTESEDSAFLQRHAHRTYNVDNGHPSVSSVVVVSRKQWDTIGGFDEQFRGWGFEDTAFAAAAETFGGVVRMDGAVFHYWHPTAREGKRGTPSWSFNSARGQAYRSAIGNPAAIRSLQRSARPALSPHAGRIPRILHRVVPEQPNATADSWWARFEELHPDWELRTHRDPLDPKDWPLTRDHWDKCSNGAQFADLIRLEALITAGGVYVDQDVEPLRSLEPLLYVTMFAAWEDEKTVPNAVMGAVPDHPALHACLELMLSRLPGDTWQSGPGVMTSVLPGRPDVLLLPPGSFYPVHYNDPNRDTLLPAGHPPWTFAVHHYWGSWLEESRRRVPA
jgi:hypothetical protein